ncbi:hypothetical protein GCM10010402_66500 [Actinomadura luteofluorescens]|uniref:hypothetical protein n=1 Tax=Actinomadura luteofluorescens TaxID=46163 RepID=UPI002164603E|nr:hypothetical protein [Actinomadura glauciflava]MCR3744179.1 hypothetical protein [Actinomadura glauciflava]
MPTLHYVVGTVAAAVASASSVLLATHADHDLARSAAMVGVLLSTATGLYLLIDRRMSQAVEAVQRVENGVRRVVSVDHDILHTLHEQRSSRHLN